MLRIGSSSWRGIIGVITASILWTSVAHAQTTGAEIRGKVLDESGGVLPGATLTIRNLDQGVVSTAVTGVEGQYRVPALVPGPYELKAELTGFGPVIRSRVDLVIGQIAQIDLTLKLASVQEQVTVTSDAPLVETTRSGMSNVVTKEQVASLPILGRTWQQLALLTPGASQPVGTRGAFTAAGTTGRDPSVQMDGADSNDDGTGSAQLLYSQEAIREFNVMTNRFAAEYGRTQSAAVNVVHKSGANEFSGSGFGFFRNKALDSPNFFTKKVEPYKYRQAGTSVGGPVQKNKLFFFIVYENQYQSVRSGPNTGVPLFDILRDQYTQLQMSSSRVDASLNNAHRAFVRAGWSQQRGNAVGSGLSTWQNVAGRLQTGYSVVAAENWVINSRMVNEFRAQTNRWWTGTINNFDGPEYNFPSAILGSGYRNPQSRLEKRVQMRDDLSISSGNHNFKLGVNTFPWARAGGTLYQNYFGRYFFRTDPKDWTDKTTWPQPYLFRQSFGVFVDEDTPNFGGAHWKVFQTYFQDDWRIHERLTLNLGLRYDIAPGAATESFSIPGNPYYPSFGVDKDNFGPRVGAAYTLGTKRHVVVRGGYGLYQAQPLIGQGEYRAVFNGQTNYTVEIANPNLFSPLGGQTPAQLKAQQKPGEIQMADPTQDVPHTHQSSVGFSAELPGNMALSADFVYVRGKNQWRWRDINLFENCQDVAHGCARPDPKYTRILDYESRAESEYKALLVSFNRRFRSNIGFQVSYTLAKSMNEADDASSIADPPSNMFVPRVDWGPALNDQRHLLVASGNGTLPFGFRLSGIVSAGTGMPHKTLAGFDVNGDGSTAQDRPAGWSRNSRRAAGVVKVDMRLARVFSLVGTSKLEAMFEMYNLFNRQNYDPASYGTTIGKATFDLPGNSTSAFYQPRQGQVALRFTF